MKGYIKLTDLLGNEYYYTDKKTDYSILINTTEPNALHDAAVFDENDEQLYYIDILSKADDMRMEFIPLQNTLGTYLSTFDKEALIIGIYLILCPFIAGFITYLIIA